MPEDAESIRERLRSLGVRRRELEGERDLLGDEIRAAVDQAKGAITMVETAQLLDLDRTALYRTYFGA